MSNSMVFFKSNLISYSVFLIAFLMYSNNATAQATDAIRSNFLNSFYKSCYETQTKLSLNANVSLSFLKKYCSCMATYVADSTNNEVIKDIDNGKVPVSVINPALQLGGKYCAKKVSDNN